MIEAKKAETPGRQRYLQAGFLALSPKAFGQEFEVKSDPPPFEECGSVAVIHICTPLEQHPNPCWQDYETLRSQAEQAFASPCRAVALCINSPGGAASGCFELARALRAMSETSRKPLGVFIDGMACSAAYAIACAATAGIYAPQTSTVGSLAVYEMLVDQTAQDHMMGLRFLFVPSSGADLKLTGNGHIVPTDEQVAHTQGQVDLLTDYFYSLVEEMRGIPQADIRELRGAALLATQGLTRGLVDTISDWRGFLSATESKGITGMTIQAKAAKSEAEPEKSDPMDEAIKALHALAFGEDEDKAGKARKALRMIYSEDKKDGGAEDEPEKAEGESDEKPKADTGEYSPKAEDKKEEPKAEDKKEEPKMEAAQARASTSSNEVDLAKRLHALEAERASEKESARRAELFAKRPDFSAEVRRSLAKAPVSVLEDAVANWPRVNVTPQAAASAATPGTEPGLTDGARPGIDAAHSALLDRMGKRGPQAAQARVEGSSLVLDHMSIEAAVARVKELAAQGVQSNPQRTSVEMAAERLQKLATVRR